MDLEKLHKKAMARREARISATTVRTRKHRHLHNIKDSEAIAIRETNKDYIAVHLEDFHRLPKVVSYLKRFGKGRFQEANKAWTEETDRVVKQNIAIDRRNQKVESYLIEHLVRAEKQKHLREADKNALGLPFSHKQKYTPRTLTKKKQLKTFVGFVERTAKLKAIAKGKEARRRAKAGHKLEEQRSIRKRTLDMAYRNALLTFPERYEKHITHYINKHTTDLARWQAGKHYKAEAINDLQLATIREAEEQATTRICELH